MTNTTHYNLVKPDPANDIDEEFLQLQQTLDQIDTALHVHDQSIAGKADEDHGHPISEITGLPDALAAKMPANQTFSLDSLTDVDGAAAASAGYLLVKTPTGWVPAAPGSALGDHEHPISKIIDLQVTLDSKANTSSMATALDAKLDDSQLDTDGTLAANNPGKIPAQSAVKTYVDTAISNLKGGVSSAWDTLAKLLAGIQRKPNYNEIVNGNFDIWQRAISQTTSGYGSDDRWSNAHSGSTKTHSQQAFVNGQTDVPGNPKFHSRTVVVSAAGAANYVTKVQAIEGVQRNAGRDVTVTFWAKADAAKNIAIEFTQYFGTGGSPSAQVTGIGSQLIALTTTWQKFTRKVTLPSIVGKTLGTNGNDYLQLSFWFDAGSSFNARTANLGQQSGTFDIAHVSLVSGDATGEDDPFPYRHPQQELALCQRYYQALNHVIDVYGPCSYSPYQGVMLPVTMRATPTVSFSTTSTAGSYSTAVFYASKEKFSGYLSAVTSAASNTWVGVVRLDAEL